MGTSTSAPESGNQNGKGKFAAGSDNNTSFSSASASQQTNERASVTHRSSTGGSKNTNRPPPDGSSDDGPPSEDRTDDRYRSTKGGRQNTSPPTLSGDNDTMVDTSKLDWNWNSSSSSGSGSGFSWGSSSSSSSNSSLSSPFTSTSLYGMGSDGQTSGGQRLQLSSSSSSSSGSSDSQFWNVSAHAGPPGGSNALEPPFPGLPGAQHHQYLSSRSQPQPSYPSAVASSAMDGVQAMLASPPPMKATTLKFKDKFLTDSKGQLLTLGAIRALAMQGDPLALAFLGDGKMRNPIFNRFVRPLPSLETASFDSASVSSTSLKSASPPASASASRKSTSSKPPAVDRKNCDAEELWWSVDCVAVFPGDKEPMTEGEVQALTQTTKGQAWATAYLGMLRGMDLAQWKTDRKALQKDALNLGYHDLLFTPERHAINPKTGKPFAREEVERLKDKERTKQWVESYIGSHDQTGWPVEEETKSTEGDGGFSKKSKAAKACDGPGWPFGWFGGKSTKDANKPDQPAVSGGGSVIVRTAAQGDRNSERDRDRDGGNSNVGVGGRGGSGAGVTDRDRDGRGRDRDRDRDRVNDDDDESGGHSNYQSYHPDRTGDHDREDGGEHDDHPEDDYGGDSIPRPVHHHHHHHHHHDDDGDGDGNDGDPDHTSPYAPGQGPPRTYESLPYPPTTTSGSGGGGGVGSRAKSKDKKPLPPGSKSSANADGGGFSLFD